MLGNRNHQSALWGMRLGQVVAGFGVLLVAYPAVADSLVVPDDTLGTESSVVNAIDAVTQQIDGGAARGANLFHSFLEFNVGEGQQVYFANPVVVERIFSRVTGDNPSAIDGLLGVDGTASLYFLNPNGVMFGPEASLDIVGSLEVSTAEGFGFEDGSEFNAIEPGDSSLLTVSIPLGLQVGPEPVEGSVISSQGSLVAGQDLTLLADEVDLQGQIVSGGDLNLLGTGIVRIRDSEILPFIGASQGDLLVQGNEKVDVFILNHPESGFFSLGNLVLSSDNPIIGDAHFYANGHFKTEQLDGTLQDLISPTDPIILTGGNIELEGDYTGASLHILAGGSVTLGNVTIDNTGPVASTINPSNTTPINSNLTYADLASFEVPDYKVIVDEDGTVSQVPIQRTIRIDGSSQSTLDVRAGVDWTALGGLPANSIEISGGLPTRNYENDESSSTITIMGDVRIDQPNGQVILTNLFKPRSNLDAGRIATKIVDASTRGADVNGGSILIYSQGDIITGNLDTSSGTRLFDFGDNAGEGGNITLFSQLGDIISNGRLSSGSRAVGIGSIAGDSGSITLLSQSGDITTNNEINSTSGLGIFGPGIFGSGRGGQIVFSSQSGNITANGRLRSGAYSLADLRRDGPLVGGGDIVLSSQFGNVTTNSEIDSSSSSLIGGVNRFIGGGITLFSQTGDIAINEDIKSFTTSVLLSGDAGEISITTIGGSIQGRDTRLLSVSIVRESFDDPNFEIGESGIIMLTAKDILSGLDILTLSSGGQSGLVQIHGLGNLLIKDTHLVTSAQIEIPGLTNPDDTEIFEIDDLGLSGNTFITSDGNLTFDSVQILSDANGPNAAGNVDIYSPGWITFDDSVINSNTNSTGQAGSIDVVAGQGVRLTGATSQLLAQTNAQGPAGSIFVDAPQVIVENNAQISATSSGGPGGNITINGDDIVRIDNSIITSELLEGAENDGEGIEIFAGNLELANGAEIRTVSAGNGDAGNIILNIRDTFQAQDGSILTNSEATAGGVITVNAPNVRLFGDSDVVSFVNSGAEGGGNITFNGDTVIALDDSDILAFATDGRGGDITFNAAFFGEDFVPGSPPPFDGNDRVDVNASGAISGEISIPDVSFIQNSLSELADTLVDPNTLTAGSCIAHSTDAEGSFTVTGTDGLPQRPDDTTASAFPAVAVETLSTNTAQSPIWQAGDPIVEPEGTYVLPNGRILLSRECQ